MNRLSSSARCRLAYLRMMRGSNSLIPTYMSNSHTTRMLYQGQVRHMSDNLLGYNPMAGSNSINKNVGDKKDGTEKTDKKPTGPIIGVDSNTAGGGVWAQTSAKRDKLGELRIELDWDKGQRTLDDAATREEKLDLHLIDGIMSVASLSDGKAFANVDTAASPKKLPALDDFYLLLKDYHESFGSVEENSGTNAADSIKIDRHQFEAHISHLLAHVEAMKLRHIASPSSVLANADENTSTGDDIENRGNDISPLAYLRDIMPFKQPPDTKTISDRLSQELVSKADQPLHHCHEYFRILLLESCLRYLSEQWDILIKMSDADMDRAATKGEVETLIRTDTLSLNKIHNVLHAFAHGSCSDRVKALWDLMDKDDDGMLDQAEMNTVVEMSLNPVEDALRAFVTDSIAVWPMRRGLPAVDNEQSGEAQELSEIEAKKGRYQKWKDGRKERKANKIFLKAMDRAIKRHFDIEVETPHRLRCIYAWAEKKHQDGKLENVLVDNSSGAGGRKRYVELDPKIAYEEFREVQLENYDHLDKVGEELCTSLKEEMWVHQGTGRQNQELKREGFAFLAVVALIDFGIMIA